MIKVLLLTSRLPYPPVGGDKLKNYNLIKILSKYYDVHLVTLTDEKLDDKSKEFLEEYTTSYQVFTKSKIDFLMAISRSLYNKEPLQVNYYYFNDVQKYIDNKTKKIDFIISTLIRTSKYAVHLDKPKIFDMADSIGQNYKKSLQNVKSLFWKIIYKIESTRLIDYEKYTIDKYNTTLMFNKEEIKFFDMENKIKFIPHGVNEDLLLYDKVDEKYKNNISFFGKMDYQPNIDAVLWFIENILDKLNQNILFYIVGAKPTNKILELEKKYKNIVVTGFVDDPYEILKSSMCIVTPMQTGAGIQNKVLETMALGTINIISSLAAKPIGAINKKDYIVLDEPIKISNEINKIYENKQKYDFYKQNSKEFIKNSFTWSIYEKVYIDTIKEILNDNKN